MISSISVITHTEAREGLTDRRIAENLHFYMNDSREFSHCPHLK